MKFNNRFCALMDIPDLPAGAFMHIGDKKIKPQGGGNPFDSISSALGTDGGGGGVLGALADIDPGPAIGQGLAEVDTFVNREIPGGYILPAALAVAAATGYLDPSLLAGEAAFTGATETGLATLAAEGAAAETIGAALLAGGTEAALSSSASAVGITSEAGQQAFFQALAQGATGTEAVSAGLLVEAGGVAAGSGAAVGAGYGSFGSLNPALPAAGGVGGAGAGLSAQLAPGTILGTGLPGGGAIGSSYMLGANGLPAVGAFGQLIPASSVSFGGQAALSGGLSAKNALDLARVTSNLISKAPPEPQPQQIQQSRTNPYGGVDYSGLYNLLAPRMTQRNPNSLLG